MVERQEAGLFFLKLGGHRHFVKVNGKVCQYAGVEVENKFFRVTVVHKLVLAVGHALPRELVLQFQCDHGNTVHRKHHINGVVVIVGIGELTGALQNIGVVSVNQILIEVAARSEVAELYCHTSVLDSVAQHVNQSVLGDIRLEHLVELVSRFIAV